MNYKFLVEEYVTSFAIDYLEYDLFCQGKLSFEKISVYDIWFKNNRGKGYLIVDSSSYKDKNILVIPISVYMNFLIKETLKSQMKTVTVPAKKYIGKKGRSTNKLL